MESNEFCVEFITNKKYFIEDTINISFKFNKKCFKPKYSDWIALYKCSSNRNLEEFVAVETDLVCSPTKHGFYPVTFLFNQLKNLECNIDYEFLYGDKFNKICGISRPLHFIHKNDCTICTANVSETNCTNCVSKELVDSLLARISLVDSLLIDCKLQSNEIMSMNKRLMTQMNECGAIVEKNNHLLDHLFYTEEPVTKDGYRWMQQCSDTDLKMSIISRQECELQDLSNQNSGIKKVLEKLSENEEKDNKSSSNSDSNTWIDSIVNVECALLPEPSTASFVFIDSEDDI